MQKRFNSKVDMLFEVILWGTIALPLIFFMVEIPNNALLMIQLVCIPTAALMVWARFGTYYTITDSELIYQSGPFGNKLDINRIQKVYKTTNDPFNSGGLSMDKISIKVKKHATVNISPENKEAFIATLQQVNPNIEVVE